MTSNASSTAPWRCSHRGLFRTFYPGTTLREHLGRPRPANRENFRRGGFLDRADRYTRAAEFVATAREL